MLFFFFFFYSLIIKYIKNLFCKKDALLDLLKERLENILIV